MTGIHEGLTQCGVKMQHELPRRSHNEIHLVLPDGAELLKLCNWAQAQGYYLCTLTANDERMLEDGVFKLYYISSNPADRQGSTIK